MIGRRCFFSKSIYLSVLNVMYGNVELINCIHPKKVSMSRCLLNNPFNQLCSFKFLLPLTNHSIFQTKLISSFPFIQHSYLSSPNLHEQKDDTQVQYKHELRILDRYRKKNYSPQQSVRLHINPPLFFPLSHTCLTSALKYCCFWLLLLLLLLLVVGFSSCFV